MTETFLIIIPGETGQTFVAHQSLLGELLPEYKEILSRKEKKNERSGEME